MIPDLPTQMTRLPGSNESLAASPKFRFVKGRSLFGVGRGNHRCTLSAERLIRLANDQIQGSSLCERPEVPVSRDERNPGVDTALSN